MRAANVYTWEELRGYEGVWNGKIYRPSEVLPYSRYIITIHNLIMSVYDYESE